MTDIDPFESPIRFRLTRITAQSSIWLVVGGFPPGLLRNAEGPAGLVRGISGVMAIDSRFGPRYGGFSRMEEICYFMQTPPEYSHLHSAIPL